MESYQEQLEKEVSDIKAKYPDIEKIINIVLTQHRRSFVDYDCDVEPIACMYRGVSKIIHDSDFKTRTMLIEFASKFSILTYPQIEELVDDFMLKPKMQ